ncbi:MAG TPA: hypothetical protein VN829_13020, partial [Dongiaceae bacterium]|nr:hypothetical protein [Dongiaceae bacterium]
VKTRTAAAVFLMPECISLIWVAALNLNLNLNLTVAFGQVQNDRGAGAIQLVAHGDGSGQLLQNRLKPRDESQRRSINLQFFMVEQAVHSD